MYGFMDQRRAELAADWAGGDVNQADTWLNREATSDEDVRQEPMRSTSPFSSSSRLCIPCIRCSCSRCSRVVRAVPPTGGAGGASPPIAQEEGRGLFQNDLLKKNLRDRVLSNKTFLETWGALEGRIPSRFGATVVAETLGLTPSA